MAVAVMLEFPPGMTTAVYDEVNDAVFAPGQPEGLVFHSAGLLPDGTLRVVDVWETRAQFDANLDTRVKPALAGIFGAEAMAAMAQPALTEWTLHNHEVGGA